MADERRFGDEVRRRAERKRRAREEGRPTAWFGLGMFGLVGWAVAKLSGKTLAIVGGILALFFIAILIMGQLFVF